MIIRLAFLLLFVVSAGLLPLHSTSAKPDLSDIEARIVELLAERAAANEPGYAVGIMQHGALTLSVSRGMADLGTKTPISSKTVFNLASLSKQFTGAAVALEIHEGRMDLDAPFRRYVPHFPRFADPVGIDHLVFMTSGLPEYYDLPPPEGLSWRGTFTVDDAIRVAADYGALRFRPGTRWMYSNLNYMLLTKAVEHTSGMPFVDYMHARIFQPLNMSQTLVHADLQTPIPGLAHGYESTLLGWRTVPRRAPHYGGSGVFSSIEDLAKWDHALTVHNLAGPAYTKLLLSTKRFQHDKDNDAFGIVHGDYDGKPTHWYAGDDFPYTSHMLRFPQTGVSIYVLSNRENGRASDIAHDIAGVLNALGALD